MDADHGGDSTIPSRNRHEGKGIGDIIRSRSIKFRRHGHAEKTQFSQPLEHLRLDHLVTVAACGTRFQDVIGKGLGGFLDQALFIGEHQ